MRDLFWLIIILVFVPSVIYAYWKYCEWVISEVRGEIMKTKQKPSERIEQLEKRIEVLEKKTNIVNIAS